MELRSTVVDQDWNPDMETLLRVTSRSPEWQLGTLVVTPIHVRDRSWSCLPHQLTQCSQQSNSRPFLVPAWWGSLLCEVGNSLTRVLAFTKFKGLGSRLTVALS